MEKMYQYPTVSIGRRIGLFVLFAVYTLLMVVPTAVNSQTKVVANHVVATTTDQKYNVCTVLGVKVPCAPFVSTVENPSNAQTDDNLYSRLHASPGLVLGLGSYKGGVVLTFPEDIPADQWSYVRISADNSLLQALLGGSLGKTLGTVLGAVLLGNQEIEIEALDNTTSRLKRTNTEGFDTDRVRLMTDADGNFYIAIKPSSKYNKIKVTNQSSSIAGLAANYVLDVYSAVTYNSSGEDCGSPTFTSFDGTGIGLSLLDLQSQNLGDAIDNDLNSYSTLKQSSLLDVQVAGSLSQYFYFPTQSPATSSVNIKLALAPSGILNADLLGGVELIAWDGDEVVYRRSLAGGMLNGVDILSLLQNGEATTLTFAPGKAFDRIEVRLNSPVGLNLAGSSIRIYDVKRYDGVSCDNPLVTIPNATANPFEIPACDVTLLEFENVDFAQNIADGNNETFATLYGSNGSLLSTPPVAGMVEIELSETLPAFKTSYVRIDFDQEVLNRLVGGSLGKLVADVGGLLLGNHFFDVVAKNGSTPVLSRSSSDAFENSSREANGIVTLVQDNIGRYYLAITPSNSYNRVQITNRVSSLLPTGEVRSMKVYNLCYEKGEDRCFPPNFTSYEGGGLNLGIAIGNEAGVTNPYRAISANSSEYSEISLGTAGVVADVFQTVYFSQPSELGDMVRVRMLIEPSSVLSLDVLGQYRVDFYNGTELVDSYTLGQGLINNIDLLALFNSGGIVNLEYIPTDIFDRVKIGVSSTVALGVATPPIRLYNVKRISDDCPEIENPSPFVSPVCADMLVDAENADDIDNLFDTDFDSFATLNSGAQGLLGLGGKYAGFVELGYSQTVPAGTTSYIRIDFDQDILNALVGGSLGNVVTGLLNNLLLGDHFFEVEVKQNTYGTQGELLTSTLIADASSADASEGGNNFIRVVRDKDGRFYIAVTPDQDYNAVRITDHTRSLLDLLAQPNTMNVYGMCFEGSTDQCLAPFATSYEFNGLSLTINDLSGAGVTNPHYAINDNSTQASEISMGTLNIAGGAKQWIFFNTVSAADDVVEIGLGTEEGGLNLSLLGDLKIQAYLGNTLVETLDWGSGIINGLNVVDLLNNGDVIKVPFAPGAAFDRIVVGIENLVSASVFPPVHLYSVERCITLANPEFNTWKSYADENGVAVANVKGGEEITYTIHIQNTGAVDLTDYIVTDEVPANSSYVAGSGGILDNGVVTFENINVAVGATETVSFKVLINENLSNVNTISNVAFVKADAADPGTGTVPPADPANPTGGPNTTATPGTSTDIPVDQIHSAVAWKAYKVDGDATATSVSGGETVEYTIYVRNTGNQDLTDVVISDLLPAGVTHQGGGTLTGNTVSFTIPTLAVGATSVGQVFTVTVNEDLTGIDVISNVAVVSATDLPATNSYPPVDNTDPIEPNDTGTTGTDIPVDHNTDVTAWKGYVITNGTSTTEVSGGETVTYNISVRNDSNQQLTGLIITDELPAGTTYVSGGVLSGTTVSFSNISLNYGETKTFSFIVTVNDNLTAVPEISNVAFVKKDATDTGTGTVPLADPSDPSSGPDPVATPGTPTVIPVQATNSIDLELVGVSGGAVSGQAEAGDLITYTVTITNTGNQDLTGVVLSNPIPGNTALYNSGYFLVNGTDLELTIPTLAVGQTATYTYTVIVDSPLDPTVTAIISTVTASNAAVNESATSNMPTSCTTVDDNNLELTSSVGQLCIGESVTLNADLLGVAVGIDPTFIKWYSGYNGNGLSGYLGQGTSISVTPTALGTIKYYAIIEGTGFCFNNPPAEIEITVNTLPTTPTITVSSATVCEGEQVILTATGGTTYIWSKVGEATPLAETSGTLTLLGALTDAGQYTVRAVNASDCESAASAPTAVSVTPRATAGDISVSGNDNAVCVGEAVILTASTTTVNNAVFKWYSDDDLTAPVHTGASITINPTTSTTLYVTVQGTGVCENAQTLGKEVVITVNPTPDYTITGALSYGIEVGNTVDLPTIASATATVQWYDDAGQSVSGATTRQFDTPGTYTYTAVISEDNHCTVTVSVMINVFAEGECPPVYSRVYATDGSDYGVSNLLGIPLGGIDDAADAADGDIDSFSELTEGVNALNLLGQTYQTLKWNSDVAAGTPVSVKLGKQFSTASVLGTLRIVAVNASGNAVSTSQSVDPNILNALGGINVFEYTFTPTNSSGQTVPYRGVKIYYQGAVSLLQTAQIYEAYYHEIGTIDCGADEVFDVLHGVENPISGLGVGNVLIGVNNADDAVDTDPATYATMNNVAAVNAQTRLEVLYNVPALTGDQVVFDLSFPSALLNVQALQSFTIQSYLGNAPAGEPAMNDGIILNIELLTGGSTAKVTYTAQQPFDRIKILYGGVADVLGELRVHEITREVPQIVTGDNGDNKFTICPGGDITITSPDNCTTYKIYDSATSGVVVDITTLASGTHTLYVQTVRFGTCEVGSRTKIEVVVKDAPAPVLTQTTQTFCEIEAATVADLDITGATGTVVWYSAATGGTALVATDALVAGTYYAAQITDGCESVNRTEVTVVITVTPAPVLTQTTQTFCEIEAATVADLNTAGAAGTVVWYNATVGGTPLAGTDALAAGTYYAAQIGNNCESVSRTEVTVVITVTPAPVLTQTTQTFCEIEAATVADLNTAGATGTVVWYNAAVGGTPLAGTDALAAGTYYAAQIGNNCESVSRTEVTVVITVTPAPVLTQTTQTFCEIEAATVADLNTAGATGTVVWYNAATGGTALAATDALVAGTYYAAQITDGCESVNRTEVTVVITVTPAPVLTQTTQTFCEIEAATVADLNTAGATGTVVWYNATTGGTALAATDALVAGTYYAAQITDGCESVNRTEVTVIITVTPAPVLTQTTQTFCEIEAATVADLNTAGATGTVVWYNAAVGGTPLAGTDALAAGTYYAAQIGNNCESVSRTEVTVVITVTPAPVLTQTTQTFCEIEAATVADLNTAGATGTVVWYNVATGGTPLAGTDALVAGTYYAAQIGNNCESVNRTEVTVVITVTPAPTISNATPEYCGSDGKTLVDLAVVGDGIKWYATPTSTTALPATTVLQDGVTYYASQTGITGCESLDRLAVTPTILDCEVTLSIVKVADDARVTAGESTSFTITITNNGPGVLEAGDKILLEEVPSTGLTITGYSIVSGAATIVGTNNNANATLTTTGVVGVGATIVVKVNADVDANAPAEVSNKILVWGPDTPPTDDPDDDDETDPIPVDKKYQLTIEKIADQARVTAGESTSFTVTLTNNGPSAIASGKTLTLGEQPSTGLTITGYSIVSGAATIIGTNSNANATITTTGVVGVGATIVVKVNADVDADAPAEVSNKILVWGPDTPPTDDPDDDDETDPIPVDKKYQLTIEKIADQARVTAGESTSFTVTLTNNGPSAIASGKTLTLGEQPSTGLTITGYSIVSGAATIIGTNNNTNATLTTTGVVGVGATIVVKVNADVDADAPAEVSNKILVWGPDTPPTDDPDDDDETDPIPVDRKSNMTISKVADEARVKAGEATTFTVTITNNGPSVIAVGKTITLAERPGEGVTIDGYSMISNNATIAGMGNSAVVTTTSKIPVGGTIAVQISAKVDEDAPETITNGITVWGPDKDPDDPEDDKDDTDPTPVDFPLIDAQDDIAEVKMGMKVTIDVLTNDIVTKWEIDPSTVEIVQQPAHGTVEVLSTGEIVYTGPKDYLGDVQFTYTVRDAKGRQSNVATVTVTVLDNPLEIPNVITPNGDQVNDKFVIRGLELYDRVQLSIMNRWGNEVYRSNTYYNEWDGRGLNEGTYFYLLELVKGGKVTKYTGSVLIKRN
jgi:adhesin/invasin